MLFPLALSKAPKRRDIPALPARGRGVDGEVEGEVDTSLWLRPLTLGIFCNQHAQDGHHTHQSTVRTPLVPAFDALGGRRAGNQECKSSESGGGTPA
jgi:hypothetical protein